ncbi:thiol reductant ABC exporter subunit CydD [uncultured Cohaesibacter sp.]|uniref:thiol reductant ABC exporter subunit CydD n=1 Tax=uncultured Cohaesibacter sp. TaxID=1002546 RepID=UPI0029C7C686|nr:thiol reductant ABC exporter subunit CydD [uncultured Cohaesibacter sp.]
MTSEPVTTVSQLNDEDRLQAEKADKRSRRRQPKPADDWLRALLEPYKSKLSLKAWLDVATGLCSIAQVGFLALGIESLFVGKGGVSGLLPFVAGLMLVIVVRAALVYVAGRLGHQISAEIRYKLRMALARTLADQPPLDSTKLSAGDVAALGSEVIESLDPYISRFLSMRLQLTAVPLAILIAVGSLSWAVALILMICGPLVPLFMAIAGIRAKKASDAQMSALTDMSARFLDRIAGMTTLKLFRAVGRTRDEFEMLATEYRKATMRVLRIAFFSSAALELFSALGIALTAIYVAYQYLGISTYGAYGGQLGISSGLFVLLLAPEFFAPLREFAAAYHDKATAQSAAERLLPLLPAESLGALAAPLAEANTVESAPSSGSINTIAFEGCDLGYSKERGVVLEGVTLSIKAREKIAILGPSGSGKSTFLAALCGFLSPTSGCLLINGAAVSDDPSHWRALREEMAWIGQRPHMFHGSVLKNVRLAAPDANRPAVRDALKLAHADHFVAQLPRDVLTTLGETGFGISGGQIRRLAIARASLAPASLVLCDEPTADLDAQTAADVIESLVAMAKDRILIVATHDRAVADRCDRVFSVEKGRLIEQSVAPSVSNAGDQS